MKTFLLLLFFFLTLFSTQANAQVDTTKLLYAKNLVSDGFVELGSNFIQFNGEGATNIDFSVNWLVGKKYYLGFVFQQLASYETGSQYIDSLAIFQEGIIKQQNIGLRFGYVFFEDSKIASFSPDISGGWSGLRWEGEAPKEREHFGFISPALKGVFNVSDFFRIGAQLNYRAYIGLDSPSLTSKELNGLGGGIFLRIGSF